MPDRTENQRQNEDDPDVIVIPRPADQTDEQWKRYTVLLREWWDRVCVDLVSQRAADPNAPLVFRGDL
jgi:hypothetical protein